MNQTASKYHAKKKTASRPAESGDTIRTADVLRAFLLTAALGAALLLLTALLAYFCKDPAALLPVLGLASSALTAFFGGMIAGRIHRHSLLVVGLLNGIAMMLVMLPLSLLFTAQSAHYPGWASALMHTAFLILSALGALASPAKKPAKRRKKNTPHKR